MTKDAKYARVLVDRARNDFLAAKIGLEHDVPLDTICFHLHQAAEKLVKAFLDSRQRDYPYTHDLIQLLDLAAQDDPSIAAFREPFKGFTTFAVAMRYDSAYDPDRHETLAAFETVMKFREFIYERLPPEIKE